MIDAGRVGVAAVNIENGEPSIDSLILLETLRWVLENGCLQYNKCEDYEDGEFLHICDNCRAWKKLSEAVGTQVSSTP